VTASGEHPRGSALPEVPVPQRILLATDLASVSEPATQEALDVAARSGAALLIVSVIDDGDVSAATDQRTRRIDQVRQDREIAAQRVVEAARARGVRATFLIWEGRPATALMEAAAAERVDLIVMGSHGRGRVGRLIFGSVSQAVARDAPCPVMVVRPGARPVMFRAGTRAAR
jgi:nucleotide-binding universal stress UspA family protein